MHSVKLVQSRETTVDRLMIKPLSMLLVLQTKECIEVV